MSAILESGTPSTVGSRVEWRSIIWGRSWFPVDHPSLAGSTQLSIRVPGPKQNFLGAFATLEIPLNCRHSPGPDRYNTESKLGPQLYPNQRGQ